MNTTSLKETLAHLVQLSDVAGQEIEVENPACMPGRLAAKQAAQNELPAARRTYQIQLLGVSRAIFLDGREQRVKDFGRAAADLCAGLVRADVGYKYVADELRQLLTHNQTQTILPGMAVPLTMRVRDAHTRFEAESPQKGIWEPREYPEVPKGEEVGIARAICREIGETHLVRASVGQEVAKLGLAKKLDEPSLFLISMADEVDRQALMQLFGRGTRVLEVPVGQQLSSSFVAELLSRDS